MTVAPEVGVSHLLPELFANTFVILRPLQTAGTVSAGTLQPLPDGLHHFLIFIQPHSHVPHSPSRFIIPKNRILSRTRKSPGSVVFPLDKFKSPC